MRSAKDIERSIRKLEWDIDIDAKTDRSILDELADAHCESVRTPSAPVRWKTIARVAVAAGIVGIVGLFALHDVPHEPRHIPPPPTTMSVAEMLTVGQLKAAYRRGGLGALEAQCEKAAERVERLPTRMTIEELIVELKGT